MGEIGPAERIDGRPERAQECIVDRLRRERLERLPRHAQDEQRVFGTRRADRHDLGGGRATVRGEQREERLALGALGAVESMGSAAVAVPQRAPDLGEHLVVVGVASVDLDREQPAARIRRVRAVDPRRLALVRRQTVCADAEIGERIRDVLDARQARRRPEREAHRRACRQADEDGGDGAADGRVALQHRAAGAEHEHPAAERDERAREVRVGDEDDRRRHGQPDGGEAQVVREARRVLGARPVAAHVVTAHQRQRRREHDGEQRLDGDPRPAREERREQHDRRPEREQADHERPDRRQPAREVAREGQQRDLERLRGLRHHDADEHEQRNGKRDDVGRTPHARLPARRGVEAPADVQQAPHGLHHRGERLAVGTIAARALQILRRSHASGSESSFVPGRGPRRSPVGERGACGEADEGARTLDLRHGKATL